MTGVAGRITKSRWLGRCRAGRAASRRFRRAGALFSLELVLVLPILVGLFLAVVEFCLLLSASQRVQAASHLACRMGTLPAGNPDEAKRAVQDAAREALGKPRLIRTHQLSYEPGWHTGDPVVVEVRVPMRAAAPDLLGGVGFSLEGRYLTARTVMRKE